MTTEQGDDPMETEMTAPITDRAAEEDTTRIEAEEGTATTGPAPSWPEPAPRGLKVGYLVAGLICLGIVAVWALGIGGVVDTSSFTWLAPAVLILAGVGGLAAAVLGQRHRLP